MGLANRISASGAVRAQAKPLLDWLKDIGYEKHLYDGEDNEKVAAARWTNVLEFCDWMAQRCGGEIDDTSGATVASERKSMLEVAQTISLLSTISEREKDQNVVTLSTLHASKGLEWPHVMLVGVTEGLLPFKLGDDAPGAQADGPMSEGILQRLQEERRLMYVGITRAQRSLAVSWTKKRKKGREMIAAQPSRFIAEMALEQSTVKEDPREKLRALRAEFASLPLVIVSATDDPVTIRRALELYRQPTQWRRLQQTGAAEVILGDARLGQPPRCR